MIDLDLIEKLKKRGQIETNEEINQDELQEHFTKQQEQDEPKKTEPPKNPDKKITTSTNKEETKIEEIECSPEPGQKNENQETPLFSFQQWQEIFFSKVSGEHLILYGIEKLKKENENQKEILKKILNL